MTEKKMDKRKFWEGKNILITGVNGFIGGNLAKYFSDRNANVTGIIRNKTKNSFLEYENVSGKINLIYGDIVNKDLLKRVIVEEQIEFCYHLAAQVEVGIAYKYPYLTWETNIRGTYSLLDAIKESSSEIKSIVVASSDKAYGSYPKSKMPYQEDYPLRPIFPYDTSKACADLIAQSYASDLYKLPIVITRFSNIYGPGQLNFSALIPDCIRSLFGYGEFIPRSDGTYVRDYIYVDDVVKLYSSIGRKMFEDNSMIGEVFNAGTNNPSRVKDIIKLIYTIKGEAKKYEIIESMFNNNEPLGEIDCQYMNYEKVNQYFGWSPDIVLEEGLNKTINWFQHYLDKKYNS